MSLRPVIVGGGSAGMAAAIELARAGYPEFDIEAYRNGDLTPVYFGDTLQVRLTCKEINPRANADHGEVRWDCQVTNQNGAVVAQYDVLTMVAKVWPAVAQAAE